jgi:hypothetical protein
LPRQRGQGEKFPWYPKSMQEITLSLYFAGYDGM